MKNSASEKLYTKKLAGFVSYGSRIGVVLILCTIWMDIRTWVSSDAILLNFGMWRIMDTIGVVLIVILIFFSQYYTKKRMRYLQKNNLE